MVRLLRLTTLIAVCACRALPQTAADLSAAELLSNPAKREAKVKEVVASGRPGVSVLLSWAQSPPATVDRRELFVGLADVFGQLRTVEAIPFLVEHVGLSRSIESDMWMKTSEVIESRLPAACALIRIGRDSVKPLASAFWRPMGPFDRRAAIFAISRIGGAEAKSFLSQVVTEMDFERWLAANGLKDLDKR